MKKCPFCAEEIQEEAIKCRYCGEMLTYIPKNPWYFKTSAFVVALLCVGPLALPLLWFNPKVSVNTKILVTVIVLVLSYVLGVLLANAVKSINDYYKTVFSNLY